MARYVVIVVLAVGGLWLIGIILASLLVGAAQVLEALGSAFAFPFNALPKWWRTRTALKVQKVEQLRLENEARSRQAKEAQIDNYRRENPVRIAGVPNPGLVEEISKSLEDFIAAANLFRPTFSTHIDTSFRAIRHIPIQFARSPIHEGDGPEPAAWEVMPDDLAISSATAIATAYQRANSPGYFPAEEPVL